MKTEPITPEEAANLVLVLDDLRKQASNDVKLTRADSIARAEITASTLYRNTVTAQTRKDKKANAESKS